MDLSSAFERALVFNLVELKDPERTYQLFTSCVESDIMTEDMTEEKLLEGLRELGENKMVDYLQQFKAI